MPTQLVERAIDEARSLDVHVQAMTLLFSSRVLAMIDRPAASAAYAEAIPLIESLPMVDGLLGLLLQVAVQVGVAADPVAAGALWRRLPGRPRETTDSTASLLVHYLAQRGEFEAALELLEDPLMDAGNAHSVLEASSDPEVQIRAIAAARHRCQEFDPDPNPLRHSLALREYFSVFGQHWRKLPADLREPWLDELLDTLDTVREAVTGYRPAPGITIRSLRAELVFRLLGALRELKPVAEVESLLDCHPDAARAASLFPLGLESLPVSRKRPASSIYLGEVNSGLNPGESFVPSAMLRAAHKLYREDRKSNYPEGGHPIFWRSAAAYRTAMYWAGKRERWEAEPLLRRIWDPGIALLAAIELAAGALDMNEQAGLTLQPVRIRHSPPPTPFIM